MMEVLTMEAIWQIRKTWAPSRWILEKFFLLFFSARAQAEKPFIHTNSHSKHKPSKLNNGTVKLDHGTASLVLYVAGSWNSITFLYKSSILLRASLYLQMLFLSEEEKNNLQTSAAAGSRHFRCHWKSFLLILTRPSPPTVFCVLIYFLWGFKRIS